MSVKTYTFYSYPNNQNIIKGLICAAYAGILDQIGRDESFQMGTTNYTPEFLSTLNPTGQVPAIKTPEGPLFESRAIGVYFARKVPGFLGKNDYEAAQIEQWSDFYRNFIYEHAGAILSMYRGWAPYDAAKEQAAVDSLVGYDASGKISRTRRDPLGILERHIKANKYFVGGRVTYADVFLWVSLKSLFTMFDPKIRETLPSLNEWFTTLAALPQFIAGNYGVHEKLSTEAPKPPAKQ